MENKYKHLFKYTVLVVITGVIGIYINSIHAAFLSCFACGKFRPSMICTAICCFIVVYTMYQMSFHDKSARIIFKIALLTATIATFIIINVHFENKIIFEISTILLPFISYYIVKIKPNSGNEFEGKNETEDKLHRARLYAKIHECLRRNSVKGNRANTYAIVGEWGAGKTDLIKYLIRRLSNDYIKEQFDDRDIEKREIEIYDKKFLISSVSLWEYNNLDEVLNAIIESLEASVYGKIYNHSSSLVRICCAITNIFGINIDGQEISQIVLNQSSSNAATSARKISQYLHENNYRAMLVLDDIERSEFKIIKAILPLLERLKNIKGLSIICAYSENELERIFTSNKYTKPIAQGYFKKIFDITFTLPEVRNNVGAEFCIAHAEKRYSYCKNLNQFLKKCNLPITNPRQAKNIIAHLAKIEISYILDRLFLLKVPDSNFYPDCIFLIEILRHDFKQVLIELQTDNGFVKHLSEIPFSILQKHVREEYIELHNYQINSESDYMKQERENAQNYKDNHILLWHALQSSALLQKVLLLISKQYLDKPAAIYYAINQNFVRTYSLPKSEYDNFMNFYNNDHDQQYCLIESINLRYDYPESPENISSQLLRRALYKYKYKKKDALLGHDFIIHVLRNEGHKSSDSEKITEGYLGSTEFVLSLITLGDDEINSCLSYLIKHLSIFVTYDLLQKVSVLRYESQRKIIFESKNGKIESLLKSICKDLDNFLNSLPFTSIVQRYANLFIQIISSSNRESILWIDSIMSYYGTLHAFDLEMYASDKRFMGIFINCVHLHLKQHIKDKYYISNILNGILQFITLKRGDRTVEPILAPSINSIHICNFIITQIEELSHLKINKHITKQHIAFANKVIHPILEQWDEIEHYWATHDSPPFNYVEGLRGFAAIFDKFGVKFTRDTNSGN